MVPLGPEPAPPPSRRHPSLSNQSAGPNGRPAWALAMSMPRCLAGASSTPNCDRFGASLAFARTDVLHRARSSWKGERVDRARTDRDQYPTEGSDALAGAR